MADSINYEALLNLILAKDPRGAEAARNMTPEEQQGFFDYQQSLHPKGADMTAGRPDADVLSFRGADGANLSLSPEMLVGGGAALLKGAGSGIAGAARGFAGRHPVIAGVAGMKALQMLGLPPWVYPLLTMGKAGTPAALPGILDETPNSVSRRSPFKPSEGGNPPRFSAQDAIKGGATEPVTGGVDVDSMGYPPNVTRRKPGSGASFNQQPTAAWEDSRNTRLQDRVDEGEMGRILDKIKSLLDAKP